MRTTPSMTRYEKEVVIQLARNWFIKHFLPQA
jgi:hypothetical protein